MIDCLATKSKSKIYLMKFVLCLLVLAIASTGCMKSDTGCSFENSNVVAPATEQQQIEQYLTANGITATKHASGFYYQILQPGSAGAPELCSTVTIAYTGKTTNNTQFDSNTNLVIILGRLIEGWKKGIPLIGKGGRMMLYIPPSLGYGSEDMRDQQGNIIIPGNSILVFDVSLLNFQ